MMNTHTHKRPSRLWAILALRCPRCLEGEVFSGLMRPNEHCPVCGLRFMREPGYFVGAMFISYGISVPMLWGLIGMLWWQFLRAWPLMLVSGIGTLLLLPFVPLMFRYSRILWMHFDWVVDPGPPV